MRTVNVFAALVAGASIVAMAAPAQAQQVAFSIPAGSLKSALDAYSRQAGRPIVYRADEVRGVRSPGYRGSASPDHALDEILSNTGFAKRVGSAGSVAIVRVGNGQSTSPDVAHPAADAPSTDASDIIVTAQRRQERLRDVPISITVVRGRDLDRSTAQNSTEILSTIPGVAVSGSAQIGGTLIGVRGVTAPRGYNAGSSPVGFYIDSVPFGFVRQAIIPDLDIYDLDSIEVLRGPQGTLYGASSANGVVRVLTHDADPSRFSFKVRGLVSDTRDGGWNGRGDMVINVPLAPDRLAVRVSLGYRSLSGWIDKATTRDANDEQSANGRVRLTAVIDDRTTFNASAWISDTRTGAPSVANENRFSAAADNENGRAKFQTYSAQLERSFGTFLMRATAGYVDYSNSSSQDSGSFGTLVTRLAPHTFSTELNVSSTTASPWQWSAGAIYRNGTDRLVQSLSSIPLPQDVTFKSRSWAAFGELTRSFFDGRFSLTAGLRHFEDDLDTQENARLGATPPATLISRSASFSATTPRFVARWTPSSNLMAYASYSEGFRSGFDQLPSVLAGAPSIPAVEPDLLRNYEIGSRGSLFGGTLTFDGSLYYINWKNVQLPLTVLVGGLGRSAAVNGASASGPGVDLALGIRATRRLTFGLNASWNDLKVDSDVLSGGVALFRKGDRLNASVAFTAGGSVDYSFPLSDHGLTGRFSASANYTSRQHAKNQLANLVTIVDTQGDNLLNGRARFSIESAAGWTASIFADNLTDENGAVARTIGFVSQGDRHPRLRPRTIGMQLEFRY